MLDTTPIGQTTNNTFDIIQLRKVMGLLLPDPKPAQTSILEKYITDTKIDGYTDCMVTSKHDRRSGVSTAALAIAFAEAALGNSVLFIGENDYETNHLIRGIHNMSELKGWNRQGNIRTGNVEAMVRGLKVDIVIYETFVHHSLAQTIHGVHIGANRSLRTLHDNWIKDTGCRLVYTIHA